MGFYIGFKDIIDIFLVALILYETFRLLHRSGMTNLFWGLFLFVFAWFMVSYVFQLELTGALFDRIISVGAIAILIIFQDPIRMFFSRLGSRFNVQVFQRYFKNSQNHSAGENEVIQVVMACKKMSKTHTGALIVITREQDLNDYQKTGERLDAVISERLIQQIFFKNTPLHDGAMFICAGKISTAACILPVSQRQDIPQNYGLRHRAALGITERTDALAIVVSEETGLISVADNDKIQTVKIDELSRILSSVM
ncbi:MAG: diadenylate cyclase CdaA [Paludibacteraceae bacterium]|nr:diadenylate cyclase CdaA [Paludibacteraceae bacterium]